jgi:hypothetical protein
MCAVDVLQGGNSVMLRAVRSGHAEMLDVLIAAGASIHAQNKVCVALPSAGIEEIL